MSDETPEAPPPGNGSSSEEQWQPEQPSRKPRLPRACTARPASAHKPAVPAAERRPVTRREKEDQQQCNRIITSLVNPPSPSQGPRWELRSMWELASVFNFLHVFRPLLNIAIEFSAEELETALITPNSTLDDIHMPLLKLLDSILVNFLMHPEEFALLLLYLAVKYMSKLINMGDLELQVADGEIPIIASHGAEVETYKNLDPRTRVVILKALCDIRVEICSYDAGIVDFHFCILQQEDIRNYIDDSLKHGIQLSAFRKERIGGNSHGVSYWYEDDPIVGHRLYREIRQVEIKKAKGKGVAPLPPASFHWETVATNLDEFQEVSNDVSKFDENIYFLDLIKENPHYLLSSHGSLQPVIFNQPFMLIVHPLFFTMVLQKINPSSSTCGYYSSDYLHLFLAAFFSTASAEKLFSSKNRTETSLGKKLKIDFLPEIEKIHKRKERLLKKQQREALLLDSFLTADGLSSGRSLRDRKPVTYTFDDYDRSINEAIKITKKRQPSPEYVVRKSVNAKPEVSTNGRLNGPSQIDQAPYDAQSPKLDDYEETDAEHQAELLDRRPQRYSDDFVEAVSDIDADFDSDDDIVGEAVYDEEYLRSRKQKKVSSGSEGDEEYRWEEENAEEDEEEEEYSLSTSEDLEEQNQYKKFPSRNRRGTKLRSVDELQSGLRRSKRATRPRINYRQYEVSDTDTDSGKQAKSNASEAHSDATNDLELSTASQDSQDEEDHEETTDQKINQEYVEAVDKEQHQAAKKTDSPGQDGDGVQRRRFLDLNELAPGTGFDDAPSTLMKDEDMDNF
ncbi:putative tRNA ligase [Cocos nucifera]|uniref:Putative tRNA ligase n=1 Tax=Cocos nucifera TaxID=13894 RepID=A0A8K0IDG8_COCNU|nr:putative tRNA ligase [Cocos nucifera]